MKDGKQHLGTSNQALICSGETKGNCAPVHRRSKYSISQAPFCGHKPETEQVLKASGFHKVMLKRASLHL